MYYKSRISLLIKTVVPIIVNSMTIEGQRRIAKQQYRIGRNRDFPIAVLWCGLWFFLEAA